MIALCILLLVLSWKLSWILLKAVGIVIGGALSVLGYILLGILAIPLGLTLLTLPVLVIVGLVAIISGIVKQKRGM